MSGGGPNVCATAIVKQNLDGEPLNVCLNVPFDNVMEALPLRVVVFGGGFEELPELGRYLYIR